MMRNRITKAVFALLGLIAFAGAAWPAQARNLDEIISSGTVRIGVHPDIQPLSFRTPAGEWQGFDIDLGRMLAEKLGVKAEFVPVEWKARVPALISDQIDFSMAALTRTSERAKVIDFTVPTYTENLAVLTTEKVGPVKSWRDLNREDLTMVGCRGCVSVDWMKENLPKTKMLIVDSGADLVRAIAQGRADGMVSNLEWYRRFTNNFPDVKWVIIDEVISSAYCAIGVKKGNDTLREFLNIALYEIQSEGKADETWRKYWGRDMLVKVVPQPYF